MKKFIYSCFLAFLCLYRSKYQNIRNEVVDHPQWRRAGNTPPAPYLGLRNLCSNILHRYLYPKGSCPAFVRLQGLSYLGANYPKTLNNLLWLATLAITTKVALEKAQERFSLVSLRSADIQVHGLAYKKLSLKDGSRHVCVPSYIKPKKLITAVFLCSIHLAFGQGLPLNDSLDETATGITPLKQGDVIPGLSFENSLFNAGNEISLSKYKGQLLILDFWATWCSPCIAAFPKNNRLSKELENLTILPVTYQSKEEVEKLFGRLPRLKDIEMPMLYKDNTLRHLFPHQQLPHYVWISPEGEFLTVTGSEEISEEKILDFLNKGSLPNQREVDLVTIPVETPLDPDQAFYKSLMTDYQPGRKGIYNFFPETENGGSRIIVSNMAPYMYFRIAFKDPQTNRILPNSQIKVELSDPEVFTTESVGSDAVKWEMQYGKCLQIDFPPYLKGKEHDIFQQEVLKMFPYAKAVYDKVPGKVYNLYFKGDEPSFLGDGGDSFSEFDFTGFSVKNASIGHIIAHLSIKYLQHLDGPIQNKTGISDFVTLSIIADLTSLDAINEALAPYDLELKEEMDEITILRIIDATDTNP